MAKRRIILLSVLLLILLSFFASAEDVAYIYRKNFKIDNNILQVFNESGLSVKFINDNNIPSSLSQYRLIFVGDENFVNENRIPINDKRSIMVNYYHADFWGLTDGEGVSQLASNSPLSVLKSGVMVPVYTSATEIRRPAISLQYYYLEKENKADNLTSIAKTEVTSSGADFGDVIAYAPKGVRLSNGKTQKENLCFFGIVRSDYWTPQAKSMFENCVNFVASICSTNSECQNETFTNNFCFEDDVYKKRTSSICQNPGKANSQCVESESNEIVEDCQFGCSNGQCKEGIHDISLVDLSNSINKIRIEKENGEDILGSKLISGEKYVVSISVKNSGNLTENVTFEGSLDNIDITHVPIINILPSETKLKTKTINFTLNSGMYNLTIKAILNQDDFPEDNEVTRQIEIVSPACSSNSQCGTDGFIDSPFCTQNNISRLYKQFTCENPATLESVCKSEIIETTIESCTDTCSNGQCVQFTCKNNQDCSDNNPLTFDECINPSTISSQCRNTEINCASNSDCGFTGFLGAEFCSVNSIAKNFQTSTCNNPGTPQSSCTTNIEEQIISSCQSSCSNGQCIACSTNSECNDNNAQTQDTCNNPGTPQSFCTNTNPDVECSTNSDCGIDGFIGNNFCSAKNVTKMFKEFTCNNPTTSQSFCTSSTSPRPIQQCSDSCFNGECTQIRCSSNLECDDNNANTDDLCINPGNPNSICVNTIKANIACSIDSDCGEDMDISQNFCSLDDVKKLTRKFTCNNPTTSQSFCSSSIQQNLVEQCSDSCSEGQCISIACSLNSQCGDNNNLTLDLCNDPGTPQSFCTNTPQDVTCSSNSDCGNDGLIGDNFCLGKNLKNFVVNYTCENAGTPQSFCSSDSRDIVVEQCQFICSNSQCIFNSICANSILENGEECDDGNLANGDGCSSSCKVTFQCNDGIDNDNDGKVDLQDTGCENSFDNTELNEISSLSCSTSNSGCLDSQVEIIKLVKETNSHASLASSDSDYPYSICCSAEGLSNSCTSSNSEIIARLATEQNSHISQSSFENYTIPICLSSDDSEVSCEYKSSCSQDEACLFSMSTPSNSHIAKCGFYPIQVCCSLD